MGSSPRVRGEAHPSSRPRGPGRIIPAGAGRRTTSPLSPRPPPDHPRGCGEKFVMLSRSGRVAGSSPRVRGEVNSSPNGSRRAGIIPAGAGRRWAVGGHEGHAEDHPRRCGEKRAASRAARSAGGSSPRVRGEAGRLIYPLAARWIIPAGAGRRLVSRCPRPRGRDHPRGCGEKHRRLGGHGHHPGSSPRVRGEEAVFPAEVEAVGIIPAGAGRRLPPHLRQRCERDHPRGCGEKVSPGAGMGGARGSSPRVRGEEKAAAALAASFRIIPAGAGRRTCRPTSQRASEDHPRGCGEKRRLPQLDRRRLGSSPRVRGEVAFPQCEPGAYGIIPAGAGRSV